MSEEREVYTVQELNVTYPIPALFGVDRVRHMSKEQIYALFTWLDFKDPIGHPLVNCIDFQQLVMRAVGE